MKIKHLFSALFLSVITSAANASIINGLGDATLDPALSGATVIDFESQATGSFTSLTIGDVTFSTPDCSACAYLTTAFSGDFNATGINMQNGTSGAQKLKIDFATGADAFAFNFGASNEDWLLEAFDVASGLLESYLLPQTWWNNNGEYFGIAAAGISFVTLTQLTHTTDANADHILLDNFAYVAADIPSPAPIALLLLGLAGMAMVSRRKTALNY
ncbi:hypothetical protein ACFL2V_15440 [Pseudomonadota bacterium]